MKIILTTLTVMLFALLQGSFTSEIPTLAQIKEKQIQTKKLLNRKSRSRKQKERNLKIAKKNIVKAFEGKYGEIEYSILYKTIIFLIFAIDSN